MMHSPSSLAHNLHLALCASTVALSAGCDLTGEYDKKFQQALQKSAQRAVFDKYLFPTETEVTDAARKPTGVKLRILSVFDKDSKSLPATDARAQPPFLKLPDLSYALERQLDDAQGAFLPVYLYFAAVAKPPKPDPKAAETLQATLAQGVAAALPGAKWEDAALQTPEGQPLSPPLKRLRATGQQEFMNLQTNKPVKLAGRFDLYLIDAPEYYVLIGWRTPSPQADKYQLEAAIDSAMGTVTVAHSAQAAPAGGQ
jgi:hypothetical protein